MKSANGMFATPRDAVPQRDSPQRAQRSTEGFRSEIL
jgi:hypothetical protein